MAAQRVLLVRHAESSNNDLYRRTGRRDGRHPDPVLSDHGLLQAPLIGAALAAEALGDVPVWASPTARAVQTASAVVAAGTGHEIELVPDLVEGGGIYERDASDERVAVDGRPLSELAELADVPVRWQLPELASWGGGFEHYETIPERAVRLVEAMRRAAHPVLVVVAHEWLGQHVIRATLGMPSDAQSCLRGWFRIPNASITELLLEEDGSGELVRLGVDGHLGDAPHRAAGRFV